MNVVRTETAIPLRHTGSMGETLAIRKAVLNSRGLFGVVVEALLGFEECIRIHWAVKGVD
jgi:hypothetical protein